MANQSYAYASGNLRAKEAGFLTNQDLEQMMGQKNIAHLLAFLREKGFGSGGEADVEAVLQAETEKLWHTLKGVSPDFSLFAPFLYRYDFHNAKVILKGTLRDRPYGGLLLYPVTVEPSLLENAVKENKFASLPSRMADAMEEAYTLLAQTADPQKSDAVLDKACMAAMREAARDAKVPLLEALINHMVFYADVKIALRAARAGKDKAFLDMALCPCAGVELEELERAALSGMEALLDYLDGKDIYHSREGAEKYRENPAAFEKWVEDSAMAIIRRSKQVTMGPEVPLGYLLAKEAEIKAVQMIASGLRAGQDEEKMRRRLRALI